MEYPGYGVYNSKEPSEKLIFEDALCLYEFFTKKVGFKPENIILIGRSLGSGPATYLANQVKIKCLVLISPYKSIKSVAKDFYPFWGNFIKERFNNIEKIKSIHQPIIIVHGLKV